jgi:hypothetical protein
MAGLKNASGLDTSQQAPEVDPDFQPGFVRADWTLFRTLETLGQKAGVRRALLPGLVVKELVDNALDVCGACTYGRLEPNGFFVQDEGPGLDPAQIATLFSINRSLVSSKALRRPTRGALGNGLRVVVGAVVASGGSLVVETRGQSMRVVVHDDGHATATATPVAPRLGTRVEVHLGPSLPIDSTAFYWAHRAVMLAKGGEGYTGQPSPHWYDSDAFYELCQAARERSARELVAELDGCSGAKAGRIAAPYLNRPARSLSRQETDALLATAQAQARPVRPERLGAVGKLSELPSGYGRELGTFAVHSGRGGCVATIPFVVEAWAAPAEQARVRAQVNRTPVTTDMHTHYEKGTQTLWGGGLRVVVQSGRQPAAVWFNVTAPYIPITNDGKGPDLARAELTQALDAAINTAVRGGKRAVAALRGGEERPRTQRDVILGALDAAIEKTSDGGTRRFAQRQLWYAVRPALLEAFGKEPNYDTFTAVITDHEAATGKDIPGMYRAVRGVLYHPHAGTEIPLGTREVERYRRPEWTFNKILYIEKEGFVSNLREDGWPERHDCALVTCQGFASRAVRDVLDLLGETDEPLTFFCVHDADGPGTKIYEALQEETRARGRRKVEIINLGLDPAEAVEMGLQVEPVERKGGERVPVASYVDAEWTEWLQRHRVELNAMPPAQFIAWLDSKMEAHDEGKVIPPAPVLRATLATAVHEELRTTITERILREAEAETQIAAAIEASEATIEAHAAELGELVADALDEDPEEQWREPLVRLGAEIANDNDNDGGAQ